MKNLNQTLVVCVAIAAVAFLVSRGIVPASYVAALIGLLVPSPIQPAKEDSK